MKRLLLAFALFGMLSVSAAEAKLKPVRSDRRASLVLLHRQTSEAFADGKGGARERSKFSP